MKKTFLLFAMLTCMFSSAMAFDVVVGTGINGDDSSPYGVVSKYSTTQSIYLASEIGAKGTITDIAYFVTNGSPLADQYITIYMGNTDKDSFSSTDDALSFFEMSLVFSGTITLGSACGSWDNITLNTAFEYDSTKNLAVMVCRSATKTSPTLQFQYTQATGKVLSRENDRDSDYSTGWNVSDFDAYNRRANIRLTFENPALNINGDLNHDGVVNVLDLEMLADVILEKTKPEVVQVSDGGLHFGALVPVTSIELGETELHQAVGDTCNFTAIVSPADASCRDLEWLSLDPSIARVEASGRVICIEPGRTTVKAVAKDGSGVVATCELWITKHKLENDHEVAYLGHTISGKKVMWATENLGASSESPQGEYFAWGEKVGYTTNQGAEFTEGNYNFNKEGKLTKYCTKYVDGVEDNITQLELDDDAAYQTWGETERGYWCIPSQEEMEWLADDRNCIWSWDAEKKGYNVCSRVTGESIFLPVTGYSGNNYSQDAGFYWTSTLSDYDNNSAYYLGFAAEVPEAGISGVFRYNGLTIRPVFRKNVSN